MSRSTEHNFAALLREQARRAPAQIAVRFPRSASPQSDWIELTLGEIDRAADAVARGVIDAGWQPGDRAVLLVRPAASFYGLVFGLMRAAIVPVFIDPGMGRQRALGCVRQIAPQALVGTTAAHLASLVLRPSFRSVQRRLTLGPRLGWGGPTLSGLLGATHAVEETVAVGRDDDAVIVFTSGSTGAPKGVSLTHGCMRERVEHIQRMLKLEPGTLISETLLVYTILEMCMGLSVVVPPMDLAKPATVDPQAIVRVLDTFKPTVASASPIVWQRFVRHAVHSGRRFDFVRMMLTSAAPIPVDLHRRLSTVVPADTELFTPYGATEAMPVALIGTREVLQDTAAVTARGGGTCVGRLTGAMEVRIIEPVHGPLARWEDVREVAAGAVGEIVVCGAGVSSTYRESPEGDAQAKIRDDGRIWHRMGDLGRLDDQGRLWFCGRTGHALHTAAGLVPNVPVEGIFNQHPAVFRSALVGVGPAERQNAVLCVELEAGTPWSDGLAAEILGLAAGTPYEGTVARVLVHPGFPTDTRHNSKIRNEDLIAWVRAACPDLC